MSAISALICIIVCLFSSLVYVYKSSSQKDTVDSNDNNNITTIGMIQIIDNKGKNKGNWNIVL